MGKQKKQKMGKKHAQRRQKRQKTDPVRYDTDRIARLVFSCLAYDFRSTYSEPEMFRRSEKLLYSDLRAFRDYELLSHEGMPPHLYKRQYQMANLFKKYRFRDDVFTDEELFNNSLEKYYSDQLELSKPKFLRSGTRMVLQRARKIVRQILGDFSEEDMMSYCRFGAKSNIGCPLNLAYLDNKLSKVEAFTSSADAITWFVDVYLPTDPMLNKLLKPVLDKASEQTLSIESLFLKAVPKSWKTLRFITPLTAVALFYSYGYGLLVTEKLKENAGLDIRYLQEIHASLVVEYSKTRKGATVDLSRASDSILSELLNFTMPRKWYTALKPCLTNRLLISNGDDWYECYTQSVLPMGNAATFPIETLIFYSIIKAIGQLAGIRGRFSVYGDDLIYPAALHKYVVHVFPDLGFKLNLDKTYATSAFRESCGTDAYHGVDVRPFVFSGEHQSLTRKNYAAFLYKVYNGLRRRWDEVEIPHTLRTLLIELAMLGDIYRVPPRFPDFSGVKVENPASIPLGMIHLPWMHIDKVYSSSLHKFCYKFVYLAELTKNRIVQRVTPYYWDALRSASLIEPQPNPLLWDDAATSQWIRITRRTEPRPVVQACGTEVYLRRKYYVYKMVVADRTATYFKDKRVQVTTWAKE